MANFVPYAGAHNNWICAFSTVDGQELWATPTGDAIVSSPAVANGVVYVGSEDHSL
ncbi:MAG TPA: PQQ-binding-like beta-propeller repeat protein [Methylocella sp.]|nr:PQQ-binding-like beta-propeller repeat protein [Methylocella sp.]